MTTKKYRFWSPPNFGFKISGIGVAICKFYANIKRKKPQNTCGPSVFQVKYTKPVFT